jgi:hypothetical protein
MHNIKRLAMTSRVTESLNVKECRIHEIFGRMNSYMTKTSYPPILATLLRAVPDTPFLLEANGKQL